MVCNECGAFLLNGRCPCDIKKGELEMEKKYDKRHGGPYDRGFSDSWYGRDKSPHYYTGDTQGLFAALAGTTDPTSKCITDLTPAELEAYNAGYDDSVRDGMFAQKDYGEF